MRQYDGTQCPLPDGFNFDAPEDKLLEGICDENLWHPPALSLEVIPVPPSFRI